MILFFRCWQDVGLRLKLIVLLVGFCMPVVSAAVNSEDALQLSGFASFGAGKSSRDDMPFLNHTEDWSFRSDSIIGGQAQYQFSSRWSSTIQVVARGFTFDENTKFDPVLEWLFTSYQWSPETRFRIGRMRTPLYLFSDSLEVGYAYPWVRPPVDIYNYLRAPLANFDGVDFSTNIDLGEADVDVQVFAGVGGGTYIDFDIELSPAFGVNVVSRWDNLTLRYGYTAADTDAASESLSVFAENYNSFLFLDPIFKDIRDSHETKDELFQYHSTGFQWDHESWTVIGEAYYTIGPGKDFSNDSKGWYVSFSKQIQDFAPYIVFGYYKNMFSDEIASLIEDSKGLVPVGFIPQLDELREVNLVILDNFNEKGKSYTVGVRYDFRQNMAFKVEVEYLDSTAQLTRTTEASSKQDTVLLSMVIDVVF